MSLNEKNFSRCSQVVYSSTGTKNQIQVLSTVVSILAKFSLMDENVSLSVAAQLSRHQGFNFKHVSYKSGRLENSSGCFACERLTLPNNLIQASGLTKVTHQVLLKFRFKLSQNPCILSPAQSGSFLMTAEVRRMKNGDTK